MTQTNLSFKNSKEELLKDLEIKKSREFMDKSFTGGHAQESSPLIFIEEPIAHEPLSITQEEQIALMKWKTSSGIIAKQKQARQKCQLEDLAKNDVSSEAFISKSLTPNDLKKTSPKLQHLTKSIKKEIQQGIPVSQDHVGEALTRLVLSNSTPAPLVESTELSLTPSEEKDEICAEISHLFNKINEESAKGNLARHDHIMEYICQIVVLLSRLSGRQERESIQEIQEKLQKNIKKQAKTYGSFWQTAFTIVSVAIQGAAAFMGVSPLGGASLFGKATDDLAKGSQAVSGFGSGTQSIAGIFEQFATKKRTLYSFEGKQEETLRSERDRGVNQADQTKSEGLRALQAVVSSLHDIFSRVLQN